MSATADNKFIPKIGGTGKQLLNSGWRLLFFSLLLLSGCAHGIPNSETEAIPPPQKTAVFGPSLNFSDMTNLTVMEKLGEGLTDLASLEEKNPSGEDSLIHDILATAYAQTGVKYLYGGTNPQRGLDCSGFVQYVYSQNGIDLPRTTNDQIRIGTKIDRKDLRPGDLVFYWRNRGLRTKHVGIYTGGGLLIHSPRTGYTVQETEAFSRYNLARYIQARRVVDDPNASPLLPEEKESIIAKALASNLTAKAKKQSSKNISDMVYKVKSGDSVWKIARRYGVPYSSILHANGLSKKHTLRIGQTIKIPGVKSKSKSTQESTVAKNSPASQPEKKVETTTTDKVYHVQKGDSIWILARRFGVSTNNLLQANNLQAGQTLRIGQPLAIP